MEKTPEQLDYSTDSMSFYTDRPEPGTNSLIGGRTTRGPEYRVSREQGRDDWLLLLTANGAGHVSGDKPEMTAGERSLVLFPPNRPQTYGTAPHRGRWTFYWIHFAASIERTPWLPDHGRHTGGPFVTQDISNDLFQRMERGLKDCLDQLQTHLPASEDLAANALNRVLILLYQANSLSSGPSLDTRIARSIEWLGRNIDAPFDLPSMARSAGLSPSRFGHVFRRNTGLSPQQFAEARKLDYAAQLLRLTDAPIKEIADNVGYVDAFYFSRRFLARHGKSPSRYRTQES